MSGVDSSGLVKIQVYVPVRVAELLAARAAGERRSVSQAAALLLEAGLEGRAAVSGAAAAGSSGSGPVSRVFEGRSS